MRTKPFLLWVSCFLLVACDCGDDPGDLDGGGGGEDVSTVDTNTDGPSVDAPRPDAEACLARGLLCGAPGDCCSNVCEGGTCGESAGCTAVGTACADAIDCCSGACNASGGTACDGEGDCICGPSPACRAQEESCMDDGDCCNRFCDRPGDGPGTCASFGSCSTAGEPCSGEGLSGSCCSTVCLDTDGTGPRCQFLGGCRVQDELCAADGECCSGVCEETDTTEDGRSIMRCANADSCLPAGEVCGDGGASSNCCPNGGGDTGCEPTGTGFRRCFGGDGTCTLPGRACEMTEDCCTDVYPDIMCTEGRTGTNVCCVGDGDECAFGDVCCGGICTPDSEGVLRCGSECVPDAGACTTASDCCGCACVPDATGALSCSSDPADCDACDGPQLGEFGTADGPACCNGPTVVCSGGEEFRTCILNPDA